MFNSILFNSVIISSTYSLEHSEPNELTVVHHSTWTSILCFCIDFLLLINGGFKVLFDQGPRDPISWSLQPRQAFNYLQAHLNTMNLMK